MLNLNACLARIGDSPIRGGETAFLFECYARKFTKIMISTDMEGCAGVLDFENWVETYSHYYDKGKICLRKKLMPRREAL